VKCPIDQSELNRQKYEADISVEACPACQGVWLDHGELERIQESVEHDYSSELQRVPDFVARAYAMARAKGAAVRDCPSCGTGLDRAEYGYCSQILIDVCRHCRGIWLDRDELRALEIFFERSGLSTDDIRQGFFASLLRPTSPQPSGGHA
jgi:Zn-finger nucleic acid-binding protein